MQKKESAFGRICRRRRSSARKGHEKELVSTLLDNRFELLGVIGRGTLGTVYRALNTETNRIVAIKIVSPVGRDEKLMKRFSRGMRAAAALNHRNVAIILEYGFFDQRSPYYVMDYLDGTLLEAEIQNQKFLPAEVAVPIAIQICDAIEHSHRVGVIHRNIKPSNIMLLPVGKGVPFVKVLDFGLCKSYYRDEETDQTLTSPGELLGTPEFMSPEQCMELPADARSDIYSMGCLVFNMLTGRPPIQGESSVETVMQQISDPPISFAQARAEADVPIALQDVVLKALEKSPDARQQSMETLRDELIAACGNLAGIVAADALHPGKINMANHAHFQPLVGGTPSATFNTLPPASPPGEAGKSSAANTSGAPSTDSSTARFAKTVRALLPASVKAAAPLHDFTLPKEPPAELKKRIADLCVRHQLIRAVYLTQMLERRGTPSPSKSDYLVVVQLSSGLTATVKDLLSEKIERAILNVYPDGSTNILFNIDDLELTKIKAKGRCLFSRDDD
jgi:serine/threonine protein kinase